MDQAHLEGPPPKKKSNKIALCGLVGSRFKSNCRRVGPGTIGGMPSLGVLLEDLKILFKILFSKGSVFT